jgi:polar amino acid transport system substrate-binding protein
MQDLKLWGRAALLALLLITVPPMASANPSPTVPGGVASERPLQVVTVIRPPFSMQGANGQMTGFSLDLWQAIAQETGLRYEIRTVDSFRAMLDAVRERRADLAVANISITAEREAVLDFSQPIFDSGLQIMVRQERSAAQAVGALFNWSLLKLVLPALGIIALIGLLMWFFERKHHPFFQKSLREGWWDAFWWSLQRLASAGFQDVIPRTVPGRMLGILTSVMALFVVSAFVATISATVTLNELRSDVKGLADLAGKSVGTTRGSTAAQVLKQQGFRIQEFDGTDALFDALIDQRLDAVVHDAPILDHFANQRGKGQVQLSGAMFREEKYGIALQDGSPLRERVDRALLVMRESGRYEALRLRYFQPRTGEL